MLLVRLLSTRYSLEVKAYSREESIPIPSKDFGLDSNDLGMEHITVTVGNMHRCILLNAVINTIIATIPNPLILSSKDFLRSLLNSRRFT